MDIYVSAIEQVAETWGLVRRISNYELVVGEALFRNIFELAPPALSLYSFGERPDGSLEENLDAVLDLPSFHSHATSVVAMLGAVIGMMVGNDDDQVTLNHLAESLSSLGERHVHYGVVASHYGVLETALLRTLEGALTPMGYWTNDVRKGWAAVLRFVAKGMQEGAKAGAALEIVFYGWDHPLSLKDSTSTWLNNNSPSLKTATSMRSEDATLRLNVIQMSPAISRGLCRNPSLVIEGAADSVRDRMSVQPSRLLAASFSQSMNLENDSETGKVPFEEGNAMPTAPLLMHRRMSDPILAVCGGIKGARQDGPPRMPRRNSDFLPKSSIDSYCINIGGGRSAIQASPPLLPRRSVSPLPPSADSDCFNSGTIAVDTMPVVPRRYYGDDFPLHHAKGTDEWKRGTSNDGR